MKAFAPLFALCALATPACALAAPPINPGYWESTNTLLSPIQQTSVEKRCITAADVEKFLSGQFNRRYSCAYTTRDISGGKIRLKGTCADKRGRQMAVEGQGNYTPTSFALRALVAMDFLGLPVQGEATTEARRIGDVCPGKEPPAVEPVAPPPPTEAPAPYPADVPADMPADVPAEPPADAPPPVEGAIVP